MDTSVNVWEGAKVGQTLRAHRGAVNALAAAEGVDRALAGRTLGAHLHVGGCTAGDATGTGAHYNSSGGAEVSPTTEVWLDFTVTGGGTASCANHHQHNSAIAASSGATTRMGTRG